MFTLPETATWWYEPYKNQAVNTNTVKTYKTSKTSKASPVNKAENEIIAWTCKYVQWERAQDIGSAAYQFFLS